MPPEERVEGVGRVEAIAAAIAGPAFGVSALLVRNATLLPAPLFDALAAILAAVGLAPLAGRWRGPPAATLVRGIGVALGVLLVTPALVPPFDRAIPAAALWILGATILQANARAASERVAPMAVGVALLAGGALVALSIADAMPEPARLRVAVIGGGLVALFGLSARAVMRRGAWRAFAPAPVGVLLVTAFGAIYIAYRGAVDDHVENLPLYEWTLAAGAAGLLLSRLRKIARRGATPDAWASAAQRHAQDVAPLYDRRMAPHIAAVGRWLDTGMGFDAYRAAIERGAGDAAPPARLRQALDAAAAASADAGTRGRARQNATAKRAAAHAAVMRELNAIRGTDHGKTTPRVRAHP